MIDVPEVNIGAGYRDKQVGYFRDDAGFARYLDAYRDGFATLPRPSLTADLPTALGTVRAYRFGSGGGTPLVLLPGRQAATPMWAANLPGLLRSRPVITLDLLGEPGLSVQHAPLEDAAPPPPPRGANRTPPRPPPPPRRGGGPRRRGGGGQ
ncbi:hypothetical protein ACFXO7_27405, partial [Nocardia tengchongensis]